MMRGKSRPSAETTMALVTPQRLRLPTSDFTRASLKSLATSVPLGRVRVGVGCGEVRGLAAGRGRHVKHTVARQRREGDHGEEGGGRLHHVVPREILRCGADGYSTLVDLQAWLGLGLGLGSGSGLRLRSGTYYTLRLYLPWTIWRSGRATRCARSAPVRAPGGGS
eukprot:scaffold107220_cov34-Phaeocystis_antarctica.AAC.1